jgi:hypothetical protein
MTCDYQQPGGSNGTRSLTQLKTIKRTICVRMEQLGSIAVTFCQATHHTQSAIVPGRKRTPARFWFDTNKFSSTIAVDCSEVQPWLPWPALAKAQSAITHVLL